ncbi:MAG: DNA internalization-related competence protein ComEC/Rec2 [Clostridiales Family XIII bacterium]|nr:DNA internalization-related competence protein ComEC/Rec2 [Clostridiales Family XIII bacterium]
MCFAFLFYAAGIAAEYLFDPAPAVYLAAVCVAAGAFVHARHGERVLGVAFGAAFRFAPIFLAFALAGGLYCGAQLDKRDPLAERVGERVSVTGRVVSMESTAEDYHKLTLSLANPTGIAGGRRILILVRGENADPKRLVGADVVVTGELSLPAARRNPGCFDYRAYLRTVGIRLILTCDAGDISSDGERPYSAWGMLLHLLAVLKYALLERLSRHMDETARGVMAGMLFGDSSLMDDAVYEAFQKNGTAHILSVSGIHVAIVYACIVKLLGNRRGPAQSVVAMLGLFLYAAMAQFAPSVMRASAMILTHIAAGLLRRRYDLLTGACAAAGAMLLHNPLQLFHVGFQLSFLAIFTMAFMIPFLDRYLTPEKEAAPRRARGAASASALRAGGSDPASALREGARKLLRGLLPLLVIQAGMAPYTAYVFNYFSAAAFILNVPVIFLSGIVIPIGVALMPLMCAGDAAFGVGASAADILVTIMNRMNEAAYGTAFGHWPVTSPPAFALVLYYGIFFLVSSEGLRVLWQRRRAKEIAGAFCALLLCVFLSLCAPGLARDESALVFVDVGQGDCLHIRTPAGRNILIDGGGSVNYSVGEKTLLPYLLKNGVSRIDLALVTHLHTDHCQGIAELARALPVERLAVYEGNRPRGAEIAEKMGVPDDRVAYVYAGERVRLDEDVYVEILFPERQDEAVYERLLADEDENKSSLLMRLEYRGVSVLMTGDLGFEGENAILGSPYASGRLRSDILKAGHHGSRYSTSDDFLAAVAPRVAIIQVGKNTYGHPHPDVLEKFETAGARVFRNDTDGAVLLRIGEDGELGVRTMLGGP